MKYPGWCKAPHNGKEAEEARQDAGSSQVASEQGSKVIRSTVGQQVCRAEWPGRLYAYLKRSKSFSSVGTTVSKERTKDDEPERNTSADHSACSQWKEPWALLQ